MGRFAGVPESLLERITEGKVEVVPLEGGPLLSWFLLVQCFSICIRDCQKGTCLEFDEGTPKLRPSKLPTKRRPLVPQPTPRSFLTGFAARAVLRTPLGLAFSDEWGSFRNVGNTALLGVIYAKHAGPAAGEKYRCWALSQIRLAS